MENPLCVKDNQDSFKKPADDTDLIKKMLMCDCSLKLDFGFKQSGYYYETCRKKLHH